MMTQKISVFWDTHSTGFMWRSSFLWLSLQPQPKHERSGAETTWKSGEQTDRLQKRCRRVRYSCYLWSFSDLSLELMNSLGKLLFQNKILLFVSWTLFLWTSIVPRLLLSRWNPIILVASSRLYVVGKNWAGRTIFPKLPVLALCYSRFFSSSSSLPAMWQDRII